MRRNTRRNAPLPRFSSEYLLQQALATLLVRMDGITDVQILQSAQEHGKDIVFNYAGPLEEPLPCACVIKNHPITGQVDSAQGARTVFHQVQQALDTPYLNGSGQEVWIQRVYILTPHRISPDAIASIGGALRSNPGRLQFIGGDKLFELFQKHWPDFLADEQLAIQRLLQASRETIDQNLEQVGSLYSLGAARRDVRKIFVAPSFGRHLVLYDLHDALCQYLPLPDALVLPALPSRGPNNPGRSARPLTGRALDEALKTISDRISVIEKALAHVAEWDYLDLPGSHQDPARDIRLFRSNLLNDARHRPAQPNILTTSPSGLPRIPDALLIDLKNTLASRLSTLSTRITMLTHYVATHPNLDATDLTLPGMDAMLAAEECLRALRLSPPPDTQPFALSLGKSLLDSTSAHLLIVGPAGYGKTSFCSWHALLDAERYSTGTASIFPVYVPLHRLRPSPSLSFEDLVTSTGPASAFATDLDWQAVRRGTVTLRVYLDGLDEIPSQDHRRALISVAATHKQFCPKCQCVVTARDTVEGPWLGWLIRVSLSGLGPDEQLDLARQWFEDDQSRLTTFAHDLAATPPLQDIMRVPLLATLTILVYMRTGRLPANRAQLYSTFVDLLCGGWDLAKGVLREARFGKDIKRMVLSQLAAALHARQSREFRANDLVRAARRVLRGSALTDPSVLLKELLEDGIVVEAAGTMSFAHLSFQEFLTASAFHSALSSANIRTAISDYLKGDNWWKEVLSFLIGLTANPSDFAQVVHSILGPVSESRRADLLADIQAQFPDCAIPKPLSSVDEPRFRHRP